MTDTMRIKTLTGTIALLLLLGRAAAAGPPPITQSPSDTGHIFELNDVTDETFEVRSVKRHDGIVVEARNNHYDRQHTT